jgi:hypothetical protein
MSDLSDPNVLYGGDIDESEDSFASYPSLGSLIVSDLKIGENKTSFVSE